MTNIMKNTMNGAVLWGDSARISKIENTYNNSSSIVPYLNWWTSHNYSKNGFVTEESFKSNMDWESKNIDFIYTNLENKLHGVDDISDAFDGGFPKNDHIYVTKNSAQYGYLDSNNKYIYEVNIKGEGYDNDITYTFNSTYSHLGNTLVEVRDYSALDSNGHGTKVHALYYDHQLFAEEVFFTDGERFVHEREVYTSDKGHLDEIVTGTWRGSPGGDVYSYDTHVYTTDLNGEHTYFVEYL